ncbi:MAG TPA: hypothetical protein VEC12_01075 [Bacteroidia bacterium]|nr:hypothetical protein [Bacteroidia bacterium]
MLIKETMKDFLKNGSFQNISFGITRKDFLQLMGGVQCEHYSFPESKFSGIYKYGMVEFYFDDKSEDDELLFIMFQPWVGRCKRYNFRINYNGWDKNLSIENAKNLLKQYSIEFVEEQSKYDEKVMHLITESGVNICFWFDVEKNGYYYCEIVKNPEKIL